MLEPLMIFIAAAFLSAGFVKGVIGLGLPTVSMGLLAVAMIGAANALPGAVALATSSPACSSDRRCAPGCRQTRSGAGS
jgi:hypothetical protein